MPPAWIRHFGLQRGQMPSRLGRQEYHHGGQWQGIMIDMAMYIHSFSFIPTGRYFREQVSYSNPVRQSLFSFEDCLDGGRHKAVAAVNALKRIFPQVKAEAVDLSVPMPGLPISPALDAEMRKTFATLEKLIDDHDVVFLLMDTRESRWLPTVLSANRGKLVINAALGFDSYLVMRHGVRTQGETAEGPPPSSMERLVPGERLGCYFCNDVVVPGNSTKDRTLDQQCTVTRPGVSYQASALAVELMASTLQHPLGARAPASVGAAAAEDHANDLEGLLGVVPHSIRGSISSFTQFLPTTTSFSHCSACSRPVLDALRRDGYELLARACNEPSYLADLAGLSELVEEADFEAILELADEDSISLGSSS
jgi:ubiquitin-like modifier-activating enzyme ATG7